MIKKLLQHNIARLVTVLVLPPLLLACNASGQETYGKLEAAPTVTTFAENLSVPQPSLTANGQIVPTSTNTEVTIRLNPERGGAGKQVRIMGDHFPPGTEVQIRLSGLNSGASDHVYATFQSDAEGVFNGIFVMPENWDGGEKILLPQVVILATTPDFLYKATAIFNYEQGTVVPMSNDTNPR